MTQTLIKKYAPIILPDDLDAFDIPRRPFDFNRGDRRFFDHGKAVRHAELEAIITGIRQVVRVDSPALTGGDPLWLVQALGS